MYRIGRSESCCHSKGRYSRSHTLRAIVQLNLDFFGRMWKILITKKTEL